MMNSPYANPEQLGVRPSVQLSTAFLSQAFAWMFVALLVTTGVGTLVSTLPDESKGLTLYPFAASNAGMPSSPTICRAPTATNTFCPPSSMRATMFAMLTLRSVRKRLWNS